MFTQAELTEAPRIIDIHYEVEISETGQHRLTPVIPKPCRYGQIVSYETHYSGDLSKMSSSHPEQHSIDMQHMMITVQIKLLTPVQDQFEFISGTWNMSSRAWISNIHKLNRPSFSLDRLLNRAWVRLGFDGWSPFTLSEVFEREQDCHNAFVREMKKQAALAAYIAQYEVA